MYDTADQNYLIFGQESFPSTRYRCVVHFQKDKGATEVNQQFGNVTVVAREFGAKWVKATPLAHTEYGKAKRISTDHLSDPEVAEIFKLKWEFETVPEVARIGLKYEIGVKQVIMIWRRQIRKSATQYV